MIDSVISSEAIRSALREIGEEHMETKEFDIDLKSASKQGDNFIGIVHRVTYKRKDDEGQSHHQEKILGKNELAIILKVAPTNLARREAFGSRKFFLREMYVYNDLLSYFDEFQRAKSIDIPNEGFNEYVRCYRTIDVEPNESLLLEDLSAKSFSMIDRHTEVITADHVKLVLQAMGKFHATSFAIKDQKPDKFKEITSSISEEIFLYEGHEAFKKYFGILQKKTMDAITGTELMKSYDKLIEKSFYDTIVACVIGESAEPYAIVCHGDCWSNNTLFKYDENGKPIEVCLIDWQITRYASPVTDILYYIFGCVGTELRQSHYNIFLKTYHDSLSNHLKRLGSDPEILFPYGALLDQLRKFGKFGLAIGAMLSNVMIADESDATDLDEVSEKMKEDVEWDENDIIPEKLTDKFNKRMRDIVSDMMRLDFI